MDEGLDEGLVDEGLDGNMGYIISDGTDEARAGKGENPGEDDALSPDPVLAG
jgi:hypothetical protein